MQTPAQPLTATQEIACAKALAVTTQQVTHAKELVLKFFASPSNDQGADRLLMASLVNALATNYLATVTKA